MPNTLIEWLAAAILIIILSHALRSLFHPQEYFRGGYQPTESDLDPTRPPQGGSGLKPVPPPNELRDVSGKLVGYRSDAEINQRFQTFEQRRRSVRSDLRAATPPLARGPESGPPPGNRQRFRLR